MRDVTRVDIKKDTYKIGKAKFSELARTGGYVVVSMTEGSICQRRMSTKVMVMTGISNSAMVCPRCRHCCRKFFHMSNRNFAQDPGCLGCRFTFIFAWFKKTWTMGLQSLVTICPFPVKMQLNIVIHLLVCLILLQHLTFMSCDWTVWFSKSILNGNGLQFNNPMVIIIPLDRSSPNRNVTHIFVCIFIMKQYTLI